jgi:putative ABC transport system substrate-binding protein
VGLLINPKNQVAQADDATMQAAARAMGLRFMVTRAVSDRDFAWPSQRLFASAPARLVVNTDAFFGSRRDQIVALAARHAIPAIYPYREYAPAGGLMSYGAIFRMPIINSAPIPDVFSKARYPPIFRLAGDQARAGYQPEGC